MNEKRLKKDKNILVVLLITALLISVIVASFMFLSWNKGKFSFATIIICGGALFFSVYALVLFISKLVFYMRLKKLQVSIKNGLVSFEDLSNDLNMPKKNVKTGVEFLINNGYLIGYEINDDFVVDIKKLEEKKKEENKKLIEAAELLKQNDKKNIETSKTNNQSTFHKPLVRCPGCGATLKRDEKNIFCPYCEFNIPKE